MNIRWMIRVLPLVLLSTGALGEEDCGLADLDPIALDKNKNGALSRDEAQGSALAWEFDRVDANGDGIISQPEFANRCNPQSAEAEKAEREPAAAEKAAAEKAERQKSRQASKVEGRVDKETDEAVDGAIDKGLDRLFGN